VRAELAPPGACSTVDGPLASADFLQLRLQVDRNAATLSDDGDRAVRVNDDLDAIAEMGRGLVAELVGRS